MRAKGLSIRTFICSTILIIFGSIHSAYAIYPSEPIQLIVPFPAGGNVDLVARLIAHSLSKQLGQQIVVENRPGAAGIIGTTVAAKAPDNGYTLLMGSIGALSINPSIYKKLPYNPIADFSPITLTTVTPNLLVVPPTLPVKSVHGLIALARAKPGQLNYGSGGTGTGNDLSMRLFCIMAHVNIVPVPYKGAPLAIADLIAGRVEVMTPPLPATLPFVKSGRLRALAVTGSHRSKAMPQLPTVAQSGLPGYDVTSWYGVLAPAGTPSKIIGDLHAQIVKALASPRVVMYLQRRGAEVRTTSPQGFRSFIEAEIKKWANVVKTAGIKPR